MFVLLLFFVLKKKLKGQKKNKKRQEETNLDLLTLLLKITSRNSKGNKKAKIKSNGGKILWSLKDFFLKSFSEPKGHLFLSQLFQLLVFVCLPSVGKNNPFVREKNLERKKIVASFKKAWKKVKSANFVFVQKTHLSQESALLSQKRKHFSFLFSSKMHPFWNNGLIFAK